MGHVSDVEGRCSIKELTKDIINAQTPEDVTEVKAYLGMISYYWTFKTNLGPHLKPLCKVTEKSLRDWNVECQRALVLSKLQMNNKLSPQYDPNKLSTSENRFLFRDKNLEEIQESRKEQECSVKDQYFTVIICNTCHFFVRPTVSAQMEGDSECKMTPFTRKYISKEKVIFYYLISHPY
jgi:hypothetical protein